MNSISKFVMLAVVAALVSATTVAAADQVYAQAIKPANQDNRGAAGDGGRGGDSNGGVFVPGTGGSQNPPGTVDGNSDNNNAGGGGGGGGGGAMTVGAAVRERYDSSREITSSTICVRSYASVLVRCWISASISGSRSARNSRKIVPNE